MKPLLVVGTVAALALLTALPTASANVGECNGVNFNGWVCAEKAGDPESGNGQVSVHANITRAGTELVDAQVCVGVNFACP